MRGVGWVALLAITCGCGASTTTAARITPPPERRPGALTFSGNVSEPSQQQRPPSRSGSPPASPSSPPSSHAPLLPTSRTDGVATSTDPALAAATTTYVQLATMSFTFPVAPDTQATVEELIQRIQLAARLSVDVSAACAPMESGGPLQIPALLLHADAFDLTASRARTDGVQFPADLVALLRRASAAVRQEIELQFRERIQRAMEPQIQPVYCLAALLYQRVLAIDPTNARATAQLAAYGDAFVQSCGP